MKKILIYFLLAAMIFSLVACKDNKTSDENEKVYTFSVGTTQIAINDDAAPILAALGEWRDYAESASCAFVGLDKIYVYSGFEIQTYPVEGKDYIYMIILQDDTVATEKGIRIGNSESSVIEAYGTPDQKTEGALTYNGKGMYLQFLLRDGVVTSIQYGYAE